MLLSSNGRTPVFQTDVDAGSIPVKSTNWDKGQGNQECL